MVNGKDIIRRLHGSAWSPHEIIARDLKDELGFIEVAVRPDNSSSVVSESINAAPPADIVSRRESDGP